MLSTTGLLFSIYQLYYVSRSFAWFLFSAGNNFQDTASGLAKGAHAELFSAVGAAHLMAARAKNTVHWLFTAKITLENGKCIDNEGYFNVVCQW